MHNKEAVQIGKGRTPLWDFKAPAAILAIPSTPDVRQATRPRTFPIPHPCGGKAGKVLCANPASQGHHIIAIPRRCPALSTAAPDTFQGRALKAKRGQENQLTL
jgi:hypothetical protein